MATGTKGAGCFVFAPFNMQPWRSYYCTVMITFEWKATSSGREERKRATGRLDLFFNLKPYTEWPSPLSGSLLFLTNSSFILHRDCLDYLLVRAQPLSAQHPELGGPASAGPSRNYLQHTKGRHVSCVSNSFSFCMFLSSITLLAQLLWTGTSWKPRSYLEK